MRVDSLQHHVAVVMVLALLLHAREVVSQPNLALNISTGGYHSCAVMNDGRAACWGVNLYGQIGNGDTDTQYTPVTVTDLTTNVIAVSAGAYHSCAVKSDGSAVCW